MTLSEAAPETDPDLERIVDDERSCLARVQEHLDRRRETPSVAPPSTYDDQLLSLRDQIASARLEDIPPLVEQMERLQSLAVARRRESKSGYVDAASPYFGRLVLAEGSRRREVLIGRGTYLDTEAGIRIVDWRDAPISRLYYRYEEGDEYVETFGEREIEGEVVTRRSLAITEGTLRRITAPEGTFVRGRDGVWQRAGAGATLRGGQGTATRAAHHHEPGQLGVGADLDAREDRHLREITALIDKRQFELITRPDSGLVVIQGGAGSGKTTIGLHRMAYLAFNDPRRFRPDRMLVVVFNEALARYVSYVLPALGVEGVAVRTYHSWASKLRQGHVPGLPRGYSDDAPPVVTRMKKHPRMLDLIDAHVERIASRIDAEIEHALRSEPTGDAGPALAAFWRARAGRPLGQRLAAFAAQISTGGAALPGAVRHRLDALVSKARKDTSDVVAAWADLLSDRDELARAFTEHAAGTFTVRELDEAYNWCTARCLRILDEMENAEPDAPRGRRKAPRESDEVGIDGSSVREPATLDPEDDTLLLRLVQRLRGPLFRGTNRKEALVYEHVFIDEAQDLSPVEMAVVMDTVGSARSVTMAGDVAQRLYMDNGFTTWRDVLGELGFDHVEIEPLKLSYRSTKEILDLSTHVLGPLADPDGAVATRSGAPVELLRFAHSGDAVGFLAESLRNLFRAEPLASVALVARYPEQADLYHSGLSKAEVPNLRRITDQDFPFRPGIDVTDVKQVKGLEFDYVVLLEATRQAYSDDDEARHLLHIAATRAAHQLWLVVTSEPSDLLPTELVSRDY